MEKNDYSQLELFTRLKDYGSTRTQSQNNKFIFGYIQQHEKIILLIAGFLLTGVISFCLGVEKGKKMVMLKTNTHFDIGLLKDKPDNLSVATKKDTIPRQDFKPGLKEFIQNYTIQVASYQSKPKAQKELEVLKKRGLTAILISKGRYSVVCVGNFSSKEIAKSSLSELKKRYADCFIRRL